MGGEPSYLWHPSEMIVILGVAIGGFMVSTPIYLWRKATWFILSSFSGDKVSKALYTESLELLEELFRVLRANGTLETEKHILNPSGSPIFQKYPRVLKHKEHTKFIIDNFSYLLMNPPKTHEFDIHLDNQIHDIVDSMSEVPKALNKVADWLPGFGIVAAIMGVILAMKMLGGEMDVAQIGEAIGVALVGTLTGVFLAYGIVSPFSHSVEIMIRQEKALLDMTATCLSAFQDGISIGLIMEIGRQRIPPEFEVTRV